MWNNRYARKPRGFRSSENDVLSHTSWSRWHRVWHDESVALGHNRLAIVDLAGGSQPIISDKGVVLIANGEIYNHRELKSKTGYPYKTSSDSEAIIACTLSTNKRMVPRCKFPIQVGIEPRWHVCFLHLGSRIKATNLGKGCAWYQAFIEDNYQRLNAIQQ